MRSGSGQVKCWRSAVGAGAVKSVRSGEVRSGAGGVRSGSGQVRCWQGEFGVRSGQVLAG